MATLAEMVHKDLAGKTIKDVVPLNKPDISELSWYCDKEETILIRFTDGTGAIICQDPEMNGPGWVEFCELTTKEETK